LLVVVYSDHQLLK